MGRRGPAPKPTNLRLLQGNPGKRALPKNEPKPRPIAPKCPSWLGSIGRQEWRRVAPELESLGLLTVVDGAALEAYCQAYETMVQARRELKEHIRLAGKMTVTYTNKFGADNEVAHPAIKISREAATQVKAFCAEFGLTPSSRNRMQTPEKEKESDPFEEFLKNGSKKKT